MKLIITELQIRTAVADWLTTIGYSKSADDVRFLYRVEGQWDEREKFLDGAEVDLNPETGR